ncbi:Palmitoyl-protein thioesterase 1 [Aphelenchoides bicaudatus]|nr:Palmitoyl-protein thioesterase 1 [Aphelenchoides bicaudatus]
MSSDTEAMSKIPHPSIPYAANIPQGLAAGKAILIRGVVKDSDYKRFSIDLCCGRLIQGDHRDDVALHINPRFDGKSSFLFGKADNQIVLNSLQNNVWQLEHRCENTLHIGKPFSLRILVLRDYYKITLNGMLLADFIHRVSVDRIKCLYIDGSVDVELIEFQGTSDPEPSAPTPNDDDFQVKDFYKPAVPFVLNPARGEFLPPRQLRITGTPRMNATRFEVNLMAGDDYLFHFRVDLPTREVPRGFIVRNSTKKGSWEQEEREVPFYPFKVGHTADIVLLPKEDNCEVNVDGRPLCVFNYRRRENPRNITAVTIQGDIILQSVHYFQLCLFAYLLKMFYQVLVVLALLPFIYADPTPVIIWHGMGDSCCNPLSMGRIKKLIIQNGPANIYVKNLMLGSNIFTDTEHGYLADMNDLVDDACKQIQADDKLKNGYHALGFSQGGLFVRALAQRCSNPPVKNLISIGGPQRGIYGFPYCLGEEGICDTVRRLLNVGAYVSFVQNNLVQAQYWNDPYQKDDFRDKSIFLADINLDRSSPNQKQYRDNIVRLQNMVLIQFLKDEMVVPKESEWFGFFAENNGTYVQSMNETELYQKDTIGIKELNESNRLKFLSIDANHLQISEKFFIKEIVQKYFM